MRNSPVPERQSTTIRVSSFLEATACLHPLPFLIFFPSECFSTLSLHLQSLGGGLPTTITTGFSIFCRSKENAAQEVVESQAMANSWQQLPRWLQQAQEKLRRVGGCFTTMVESMWKLAAVTGVHMAFRCSMNEQMDGPGGPPNQTFRWLSEMVWRHLILLFPKELV